MTGELDTQNFEDFEEDPPDKARREGKGKEESGERISQEGWKEKRVSWRSS